MRTAAILFSNWLRFRKSKLSRVVGSEESRGGAHPVAAQRLKVLRNRQRWPV